MKFLDSRNDYHQVHTGLSSAHTDTCHFVNCLTMQAVAVYRTYLGERGAQRNARLVVLFKILPHMTKLH